MKRTERGEQQRRCVPHFHRSSKEDKCKREINKTKRHRQRHPIVNVRRERWIQSPHPRKHPGIKNRKFVRSRWLSRNARENIALSFGKRFGGAEINRVVL